MNAESQNDQGGHDAALTPPPAAEHAPTAAAPDTPVPGNPASTVGSSGPQELRGSGARAGAIAIAVVGGVALLAAGGTAAFAAVNDVSTSVDSQQQIDVSGVTEIDLDLGGVDMSVEFDDVEDAHLDVTGNGGDRWGLTRDGDKLVVSSPTMNFGWWFGDRLGDWFDETGTVVLTLPDELRREGLDADISLGAGSLDVDGDFGAIDVEMGAGALFITGSAESIEADLSAGRAEFDLADVSTADFAISAGRLVAELTGSAPDEVHFGVSAGTLELTVPDETYDVVDDVSAGSFDNRVDTSPSASRTIHAEVSAGSATLRPGN